MEKNNLDYKKYEILSKEEFSPSVFLLRIKGHLPFAPGQFVQVEKEHFGEATFAPCSDTANKEYFELGIRGCGSTTNAIISSLPGDTLNIRGPYGNGWPLNKLHGKEIVLIAGGLGIVPLRPLIFELIRKKLRYGHISLFAGFKTTDQILFKQDMERWSKDIEVEIAVEYITSPDPLVKKGLITELLGSSHFKPDKTIVLVCGPEIMCPYCYKELFKKKIKPEHIFISYERRMECGIGICQHCNIGKYLVCKDGPVFRLDTIEGEVGK